MSDDTTQIGTATLTQFRIFPLDPLPTRRQTEVYVPEGTYPILRSFDCIFVLFSGQLTSRFRKIGDGLFTMGDDSPWGPTLTFTGRMYGPEQWQEFIDSDICQPTPTQRYVINMNDGWNDDV